MDYEGLEKLNGKKIYIKKSFKLISFFVRN